MIKFPAIHTADDLEAFEQSFSVSFDANELRAAIFHISDAYRSQAEHAENMLRIRTRQLSRVGDAWCKAAEVALTQIPGASNSTHPAHSLWLRVQLHREPLVGVVLS